MSNESVENLSRHEIGILEGPKVADLYKGLQDIKFGTACGQNKQQQQMLVTMATANLAAKPRRRMRFFVELSSNETTEINFKELLNQQLVLDKQLRLVGTVAEQDAVVSADGDEDDNDADVSSEGPNRDREDDEEGSQSDASVLAKQPHQWLRQEHKNSTTDKAKASTSTSTTKIQPPKQPISRSASGELKDPKASRFNIIERLEKRYGGGPVLDLSETRDGDLDDDDDDDDLAERHEDDDLYDSEDSFIDDRELSMNIEEIHGQKKVKTKHSGFFVNAGEEIETVVNEEHRRPKELRPVEPLRKNKRAKKAVGETSKAVKAFLDEWSDAASDWKPSAEVIASIEALQAQVEELSKTAPIKKVFPRKLDDALRNVDKLVIESHPNKWRVNGYFATLMKFLPFTKPYLKTNMLRLEARDIARDARNAVETAVDSFSKKIAGYSSQSGEKSIDQLKAEILQDRSIATSLNGLLTLQDEWVAKENEHRQLLKTEDKKHLEEREYIVLNARQERNRLFTRILALFPSGLMDMPSLRGLNRSVKKTIKTPRKNNPQTKASSTASASSTSTTKTSAVAANTTPPSRKRSSRPLKSRQVEECPVFCDQDFQEISLGGDNDDGGSNNSQGGFGSHELGPSS